MILTLTSIKTLTTSPVPLITSSDASVYINKDVVWQLLAQVPGFKGIYSKLYRQRSPLLTSDENPGILFWKQAWSMTEMAQLSSVQFRGYP